MAAGRRRTGRPFATSRKEGVVRDMERGTWGKVVLCEHQLKRDKTSFQKKYFSC